ncbi:MAG TPA: tRNA (adenosine(37)-N6)-threonylcarbamoyltransferase complex dimerization subunit type 1 TsaB [Planctomycetota bacterium]|nr:tRNA (adenosine(37)-N6)-threonylcarbamoyltransferase complex dimerization subunit type 1 TsaB [Planctomycetota bacterium]
MLAAAFETSTRRPSVALRVDGAIREEHLSGERPHASDLLPALERLLTEAGKSVRDLGLIVVGTGPGSFTGLRVAAATALGLARGTGARLFGLPSVEALCWSALSVGEEAAVVLDARQGELYFAHYRREIESVLVLHAPSLVVPVELPALLPPAIRIFGEPGIDRAAALDSATSARLEVDRQPSAAAVLELGAARFAREGAHGIAGIEPLYLRAFASRSKTRG